MSGLCWVGLLDGSPLRPWTMADISLIPQLATKLIVPHVAQDAEWDTTVYICNPHATGTEATLTFVDLNGNALYSETYTIAGNGSGIYKIGDLIDPGTSYSFGSVEITATQGVAAFALYYDTIKMLGTCYAGISAVPQN